MTEEALQQVFIEYGVYVLSQAIREGEKVDPKIYEVIHKYVEKRDIGVLPEPEEGSTAAKNLAALRKKHGEPTNQGEAADEV